MKKIKIKSLPILVLIGLLASLITGGIVWYFKNQEVKVLKQELAVSNANSAISNYCNPNNKVSASELIEYVKDNLKTQNAKFYIEDGQVLFNYGYNRMDGTWTDSNIPINCPAKDTTVINVGGVKIKVPLSWNDLVIKDTPENFSDEQGPDSTFKGAQASKKDSNTKTIEVVEVASMNNIAAVYPDKKSSINSVLNLLEKTYTSRKIDFDLFKKVDTGNLVSQNQMVAPYNINYIENENGTWRGIWFISNSGQEITSDLYEMAVMYNKESGKVVKISNKLKTDKTRELATKIGEIFKGQSVSATDTEKIEAEIKQYFSEAYEKDLTVKNFIDNEFLNILKSLQ